jgi:predicted RNA binding protein YcfA (HicA-like mRNA interferase family)
MTIPTGGTEKLGKIKCKEMAEIIRIARAAGWTVWRTRGCHFRFRPPAGSPGPRRGAGDHEDNRAGGRTLTHGSSDSDANGLKNFRADLRRAGLDGV